MRKSTFWAVFVFTLTAFSLSAQTWAAYPEKTVRIIVQYPPGGGPDMLARLLASEFSKSLGQSFVVENRAGASGNIATEHVSRADPDGYTLLLSSDAPITINPHLYRNLPFDPISDLAPITLAATSAFAMLVASGFEADTVKELVSLASQNPGKLQYASSGPGSQHHLAGELFKSLANVDIVHIPYKGFGPGAMDVMGGRVDFMFGATPAVLGLIQSKKMKPLATTGAERISNLPEVPTMQEEGLDGFEISAWFGLMAPAGTPQSVIEKIHQEAKRVLSDEEIVGTLADQGFEVHGDGPEAFAELISKDSEKWAGIINLANVTIE